jgi:hypothetical protein
MPGQIDVATLAPVLGGKVVKAGDEEEVLVGQNDEQRFLAVRALVRLAPDRVALVLRGQRVYDNDGQWQRADGHAEGGELDVVYLQWDGRRWQRQQHHAAALMLGSFGEFGKIETLQPAPDQQAVIVHSGGTWQGHSVDVATMVLLDGRKPEAVLDLMFASDNGGACTGNMWCWSATSSWRLVPGKSPKEWASFVVSQKLDEHYEPGDGTEADDEGDAPMDGEDVANAEEAASAAAAAAAAAASASASAASAPAPQPAPKPVPPAKPAAPPDRHKAIELVYRWNGHHYVLKSGHNIVPGV